MSEELTIQHMVNSLGADLKGFLEAQYHIRDESLLRERRRMLDEHGIVVQKPYLEVTPSYELSTPYAQLNLPDFAKKFLTTLSDMDVGIYPQPYTHQAEAVKAFLAGNDVMAATGTGSGKTEIFLLSILCMLAEEGVKRKNSAKLMGIRSLILYPMNALVADQLARIRRIFGSDSVKAELRRLRGRHATFGMYTGRTPFPGMISEKTDQAKDLFNNYYKRIFNDKKLLDELCKRGKWPAKDVMKFFGEKADGTFEKLWANKLKINPNDAELLMRHEMQENCPDILITNYSMLEYMLLRPIEKSIFDQTAAYLKTSDSYLTIVMDEAHMYRGATGAEVAFLLRRLRARLGITREQIRFILTTASVGSSEADKNSACTFAADLTGAATTQGISFITGQKEKHPGLARTATAKECNALASFDITKFHQTKSDAKAILPQFNSLLPELGMQLVTESGLRDDLYSRCRDFGPAVMLVKAISGNATELSLVADQVFSGEPDSSKRLKALDGLIAIGNFAQESKTKKVFIPARLHLFFKGLSGVYACVNPECSYRREKMPFSLFGRLHPEPQVTCSCGARVFELLTHRDCGAAYIKAFSAKDEDPQFLWHEPSSLVGANGKEMQEFHVHMSHNPPEFSKWSKPAWLQMDSGQVVWEDPLPMEGWRPVYFSATDSSPEVAPSFSYCPACGGNAQNDTHQRDKKSRIMDLRTKGEQPFSQLVKRQMTCQPVDKSKKVEDFPNQGRKVLLFSDGRQKAARLAKNIPDEVESDGLRQLLAIACKRVTDLGGDPKRASLSKLYKAFVSACLDSHVYLFDGQAAADLRKDIHTLNEDYKGDFPSYWDEANPVASTVFKERLYRQASGGLYSLRFMVAGWLEPKAREFKTFCDKFPMIPKADLLALCTEWIQVMAKAGDIDHTLNKDQRARIVGFPKDGGNGKLPKNLAELFCKFNGTIKQRAFETEFLASFCHARGEAFAWFLEPDKVTLVINFDHRWWSCQKCGEMAPYALAGACSSCCSTNIKEIDPNTDRYVVSRKGFWRTELKKAFDGTLTPLIIHAEEHTAQLSHKDKVTGKALTEEYELRFQDITSDTRKDPAVDVLSCTTTMEVGIDIGSLVAVGLRNVPPQRENYQQRAGRAGRRGSSVSSVVTYCQGGAHDSYYYNNVSEIVSGQPRSLNVKIDNAKIARRHVHAYILQQFFDGKRAGVSSDISSSLGSLEDFFVNAGILSLDEFQKWSEDSISKDLSQKIGAWIGSKLQDVDDTLKWSKLTAEEFATTLNTLKKDAKEIIDREAELTEEDKNNTTKLLDFLFDQGLLPTYAFPTNLASFKVEEVSEGRLTDKYLPQQSLTRALTEYAPGRIVTIDKHDYKCEAVTANVLATNRERAKPLFTDPHRKPYVFCDSPHCSYVEDAEIDKGDGRSGLPCPLCRKGTLKVMELITPEVFLPNDGKSVNEQTDDQEFSFATPAQFPVPVKSKSPIEIKLKQVSSNLEVLRAPDAELVVVNKGDTKDMTGFSVCDCCGKSILKSLGDSAQHVLPYKFVPKMGRPPEYKNPKCEGTWRNVFLGTRFKTDLLVLRLKITPPLCSSTENVFSEDFTALNDALLTLGNTLPIAIGHKFDVDPTEFSSGYRLIQNGIGAPGFFAEIYMFDNLAGGAGYSERAAECIEDILRAEVAKTLDCDCDRSCYKCLRHYQNQYHHGKLDRLLARELLDFVLEVKSQLSDPNITRQRLILRGLAEMAKHSGDKVSWNTVEHNIDIPLTIERKGKKVHMFVSNALVDPATWEDPVDVPGSNVHALNEYKLTRNLPACFLDLNEWLR